MTKAVVSGGLGVRLHSHSVGSVFEPRLDLCMS